jgi:hypothetical protein
MEEVMAIVWYADASMSAVGFSRKVSLRLYGANEEYQLYPKRAVHACPKLFS